MKKITKRIFAICLSVLLTFFSCISNFSFVYASDITDRLELNDALNTAISKIMTAIGIIVDSSQGNVPGALDGFKNYTELSEDGFYAFVTRNLHKDDDSNNLQVDADLYNLIMEYIESLKTQTDDMGVPLISEIPYQVLQLGSLEEAIKDQGLLGPTPIVTSVCEGQDSVDQTNIDQYNYFLTGYQSLYNNTQFKASGLFRIVPFYKTATEKIQPYDAGNGSQSCYGDNEIFVYNVPPTDYDFFIVSNLDNSYLNNNGWSFTIRVYDKTNDKLLDPNYYWHWKYSNYNDSVNRIKTRIRYVFFNGDENGYLQQYYSNGRSECELVNNYCVTDQNGAANEFGRYGNNYAFNRNLSDLVPGFDDELHFLKEEAGINFYTIPTLRFIRPVALKVFKSDADLLSYCRNGGTDRTVVDKSKHIKTVTITNDNHVEYNYYADDDPENPDNRPDPSDDPSGGGSGSGIDYTAKLNEIILLLNQIREDINNLDTSGGSGTLQTSADLTQVLQELALIKAAIQNKEFTYTEAWSDEDINNLIDKIDDLLEDLGIIEEYLGDIQSDVYSSANALSSILRHVASIDAKLRLKGTIQDTDDNLDWLIELFQSLLENNASIPEEISEMLGTKFPFSLPYILVGILDLLEAPPEPPVFSMPLNWVIDDSDVMGDEEFTLDFTEFEDLANAIKFFIVLEWIMLLLKLTPKMLSNGSEIEDVKD